MACVRAHQRWERLLLPTPGEARAWAQRRGHADRACSCQQKRPPGAPPRGRWARLRPSYDVRASCRTGHDRARCWPTCRTGHAGRAGGRRRHAGRLRRRGARPQARHEVIGVETAGYSAMRQLLAGETVTVGDDTIAEGIAVRDIDGAARHRARPGRPRADGRRGGDRARHRAVPRGRRPWPRCRRPPGLAAPVLVKVFEGRKVGLITVRRQHRHPPAERPSCCAAWSDGRIVRLRLMTYERNGQLFASPA